MTSVIEHKEMQQSLYESQQDQELYESQIDHPAILSSIREQKQQEYNNKVQVHAVSTQDEAKDQVSQKETIAEEKEESTNDSKPQVEEIKEESLAQAVNAQQAEKQTRDSELAFLASIDSKHRSILQQGNNLKEEAKLLVQRKEYAEAIKIYEKCRTLLSIDNFEREHFSRVAKEYTELNIMLLCNLSLCFYALGDYEQSLQHGEKVALLDPNHLKASYRRALALKKLGRMEKVFDEIRNARLIAIGKQQIDEQINKEYRAIKEAYLLTKSNSVSLNSSFVSNLNRPKHNNAELTSSTQSNLAEFLDNNFPTSIKTTPYYALCSAISSFVLLKRFISIDLVTKPAMIAAPVLTLSMFGFLQGKNPIIKVVCGAIIGIVTALLYKFASIHGPRSIAN